MKKLRIIIITGQSGSGKSTALSALEDMGYYCVDNMPVALLAKFLELPLADDSNIRGLAFVMDLREKNFLNKYDTVFTNLRERGWCLSILFLEAGDDVLLQRYSQTRRQHPLATGMTLSEGIRAEKQLLKNLICASDQVVDTSDYNVHKLKEVLKDVLDIETGSSPMIINVMSFGYKYGIPHDADLIMDVRFLINPFFVPGLKALTGENQSVKNYVLQNPITKVFLKKYLELLDYLIPLYEKEGKVYLTIAIGCTGGCHRSVVIARELFEHLRENKQRSILNIAHRDIYRH